MATTNSIGTAARDYSTLQAWEDAVPATPTGGYIGECYNDSEFTAGINISGHTTSAVNFIRLTCAAGHSFQDHANVRTNALFYDQSKGVGISGTAFAQPLIWVQDSNASVLRMQFKRTADSYGENAITFVAALTNSFVKDCIGMKTFSGTAAIYGMRDSSAYNCIAIETGGGASTGFSVANFGSTPALINCTAVRDSALGASGTGFGASATYSPSTVQNCASFGWSTAFTATGWGGACANNCSDQASPPGTSAQASKTYANQFVSTSNDFRLKAGADCINTGNTDATNAPNDISGTVRGVGTAGDIGVWEVAAAAAPPAYGWFRNGTQIVRVRTG